MKRAKKRKNDNKTTFNLVVRDGNTPLIKAVERPLSELDEVLEILKKKL